MIISEILIFKYWAFIVILGIPLKTSNECIPIFCKYNDAIIFQQPAQFPANIAMQLSIPCLILDTIEYNDSLMKIYDRNITHQCCFDDQMNAIIRYVAELLFAAILHYYSYGCSNIMKDGLGMMLVEVPMIGSIS